MKDKKIALAQYLYGLTSTCKAPEVWDSIRQVTLPVQSSPLKEYVNDVNRFLFAGGINILNEELPEDHFSNTLIENVANKYIHPNLFPLWETLAITGEIIAVVRNNGSKFSLEYFDKREYKLTHTDGELTNVDVKTVVDIDGQRYIYKFSVNAFNYKEYPLVLEDRETNYQWEKEATLVNHGFSRVPVQVIGINKKLTNSRGNSEFNWASLNIAKSIASIEYGLDENIYFFGHPLIDSPDPEKTTEDLNAKKQVLQKLPPDEGGGHELLQPQALTDTELEYLKIKKESFKRTMGITNTQETKINDASGVALRIMNDGLISRAQALWQDIVSYGLEDLLDLILKLAQDVGILNLGPQYDKSIVRIKRAEPYFAKTEQEKQQSLEVASRLIELGVDRAIALQECYYTHMTIKEIEALLRPNLEDI